MKTNKRILAAVIICILTVSSFISCNENINQNSDEIFDEHNLDDIVLTSQNPYNYVGKIHNQILDIIMNDPLVVSGDASIEYIQSLSIQYGKELLVENAVTSRAEVDSLEEEYVFLTEEQVLAILEDCDNNLENLISQLDFSEDLKTDLQNLMNFVFTVDDDADITVEQIQDSIAYFETLFMEKAILQENYVEAIHQESVLSGTSTLSYSIEYWDTEILEDDLNDDSYDDINYAKLKVWQKFAVAAVDAVAAAAGTLVATPGGGAVLGAAASALAYAHYEDENDNRNN